jgi:hypothetical protein
MLLLLINIYKFYVKKLWIIKTIEVIREQRKKEREEAKKTCATYSHSVVDRVLQRLVEK